MHADTYMYEYIFVYSFDIYPYIFMSTRKIRKKCKSIINNSSVNTQIVQSLLFCSPGICLNRILSKSEFFFSDCLKLLDSLKVWIFKVVIKIGGTKWLTCQVDGKRTKVINREYKVDRDHSNSGSNSNISIFRKLMFNSGEEIVF